MASASDPSRVSAAATPIGADEMLDLLRSSGGVLYDWGLGRWSIAAPPGNLGWRCAEPPAGPWIGNKGLDELMARGVVREVDMNRVGLAPATTPAARRCKP